MGSYRYSKWDGSQDKFTVNPDELMDKLGQNLMAYGDLAHSLRMMQQDGIKDNEGHRLPSVQDMLQRLRQRRQNQLEKYNLNSIMDEIRQRLEDILKTEREGIQRQLDAAHRKAQQAYGDVNADVQMKLLQNLEDRAARNLEKISVLPADISGRLKELTDYDFMDAEARRLFRELIDTLKKQSMSQYTREMAEQFKKMDSNAMSTMRNIVEAINQMLEQRMKGEEPDFQKFMEQFGHFFGPDRPKNLDELIEQMQHQIAQSQSLLENLLPEDRQQLDNMLDSMLDEATKLEMKKMATNLQALFPNEKLRREYPFTGKESVSYNQALKVMEVLQKIDKLEEQMKDSLYNRSIEDVDEKLLAEVMGDEAADELKHIKDIGDTLEEAGYIRSKDGEYELTPRGMRKIGQKALEDIFAEIRKDRLGGHFIDLKGYGGERIEETKKFEYGDDFNINLQRSIMNSIYREAQKPPVRFRIDDFEIYQTEATTQSATVLMLDLSLSMPMRGNFQAAKRVAVALDGLIRSQYPKDSLYIVGFSSYARRIKATDLSYMGWDEFDPYTNIQHGLLVSRQILDKERCSNKQIIMISDGEPTAHLEGGNLFFQYPPSLRTLQYTMREVRNCTQKGIVINTFMLDSGRFLSNFVTQMARINKGRVFFTNADSLGQYLLVDYISNKKRKL